MQTKQEIKEIWQNNNQNIKFICTCSACPEQYDVMSGKTEIGYIRLRWGVIYCEIPFGGSTVFETNMDDSMQGCFNNEKERQIYLESIRNNIISYLESDEEDIDEEDIDDDDY